MKRLLLPSEKTRIPSEGSLLAVDCGGLLLLTPFFISVVTILCIKLGEDSRIIGWAMAHHLHWMYGGLAVAILLWLWKALRWRRISRVCIMGFWAFFSLLSIVPSVTALMVVNTLNFAPFKPVAGRVLAINAFKSKRNRETREVVLQRSDGTRVIVPLSRSDWEKAFVGRSYQRGMREGLLGILWCWSWE